MILFLFVCVLNSGKTYYLCMYCCHVAQNKGEIVTPVLFWKHVSITCRSCIVEIFGQPSYPHVIHSLVYNLSFIIIFILRVKVLTALLSFWR